MHRWLLKLRFFPKTYIPRALFLHMWWNVNRIRVQKLLEKPAVKAAFTEDEMEQLLTYKGLVARLYRAVLAA